MSRRHCVFVVLLLLALWPDSDEIVLSLFGVERDRPAWCPVPPGDTERPLEPVPTWPAEPAEVCPLQASTRLVSPESLAWCPVDEGH